MGDGNTMFGIKREYLFAILAALVTSLLWWFFHKPVDNSKAIIKEALKEHLQIEQVLKKKNDSLKTIILDLNKQYRELKKDEIKTNRDYDKIRNNPISNVTADSMLRTIHARGQKRFR